MKNRVSRRFEYFDSSAFRDVIQKKQQLTNPIDLSVGEPEDNTHHQVKKAGIKAIENDLTGYAPANGLPELRRALQRKVARENDIDATVGGISVVPGLTTGLLLVYMSILDSGDELITIDPGYPPYEQLARTLGVDVVPIQALPSFQLNIPAIEAAVTDKTKAIVINSPNNPTGAVYPEKDLRKIASLAKEHDFYVISDEIYEHFVYDGEHFSIGSIYPDTISMFGFSKQHAMTGWRLGYVTGPRDVIDAIDELQQYAIFSSSAIAQHAAMEALKTESELTGKYRKKHKLVLSSLKQSGISVSGAQGSYYVFFKAPNDLADVEFIDRLLEHNLILIPGRAFSNLHSYVRLSYGSEIAEVEKGMKVLTKVINMLK